MKLFLTVITAGIILCYPFVVYYGLNYFSIAQLTLFLLAILLVRIVMMKSQWQKMPWLIPATILGSCAVALSFFTQSPLGIKLYPLIVNGVMLAIFAYSYFKPPTVIESLARLTEKDFPAEAVSYTAKVTLAWCAFFVINGAISLYTALAENIEMWMLYNGFISYLAMGVLMAVEFAIRLTVKKKHRLSHARQSSEHQENSSND